MEKKLRTGIYVHLPFCSVHCLYCDFPITTRMALSDRYYRALVNEIRNNAPDFVADTMYFGGGTPSLAPVELLREVLSLVSLESDAEITLEANPDNVTAKSLEQWRSTGINRLSLGVQSLEDEVLKRMLRQHSSQEGLRCIPLARSAGVENINVDLILGYPGQTAAGFYSGLLRILEELPEHFSIYLLEVHDGTALHRLLQEDRIRLMDEEEQIGCFETAIDTLNQAGYTHYEVSNFALNDRFSRHNMKYWTDAPYKAYGPGACSYDRSVRIRNRKDIPAYIDAVEKNEEVAEEIVEENEETRARNALIFGLRKLDGINMQLFENAYSRSPVSLFGPDFHDHLKGGLLEVYESRLRLTRKGMLLSNYVLSSAIG